MKSIIAIIAAAVVLTNGAEDTIITNKSIVDEAYSHESEGNDSERRIVMLKEKTDLSIDKKNSSNKKEMTQDIVELTRLWNQNKEENDNPKIDKKEVKEDTSSKPEQEKKTKEAPKTEVKSSSIDNETVNKPNDESNETIMVRATAYTAKCDGCTGITFTGVDLNANPNEKVIAVDPNVIPLGTKVYVEDYGYAIAADIGSAIKGNRIDIHVPTKEEAFEWGVREVQVTIIE